MLPWQPGFKPCKDFPLHLNKGYHIWTNVRGRMRAHTGPCTNWRGKVTCSSCFDPVTLFHDASVTTTCLCVWLSSCMHVRSWLNSQTGKRARHAFRREISLISLLGYQLDKFKVLCSPCDLFPFNWKNSLQCAASTTHYHSHTIIHLNIPLQYCHRASILQTLHENSIFLLYPQLLRQN